MDENQIIELLEELAETLGLRVSYEPIRLDEELGNRSGGFCLLEGKPIIIINPEANSKEKIRILSEAVKQFDLDQIYLRPILREILDRIPEQRPIRIRGHEEGKMDKRPSGEEQVKDTKE